MRSERPARWWLSLIGLPIGFVSSLCGIGGGLFASTWLHFVSGFRLRRATGTALVLVFATTIAATVAELLRPDLALDLVLLACVAVGVWIGTRVGFVLSERLPERGLRIVFCVVLLVSSWRLTQGGGELAPEAVEARWSAADLALAAVAGFLGGTTSPLLGVGGGLVLVPALYLVVGTPFDLARASGLAAGAWGSFRSLRLKAQVGRVSFRHGLLLGAGSLIGAAAGVLALEHHGALREAGRWLLSGVLALLSLRFGLEAARGRRT